jgi:transposase
MPHTLPVFVGLDYHQNAVQVCVLDGEGRQLLNRPLENDARAIAAAVADLGVVRRAGIESCCGAADLAQELVDRVGWTIDLAHPGYVARMRQSPDKSDFSDGRMIADLVRVGYLPKV